MSKERFDPREESFSRERDIEGRIRPKEFEEFAGQDKVIENLKILFRQRFLEVKLLTIYFCMVLRVLERPL